MKRPRKGFKDMPDDSDRDIILEKGVLEGCNRFSIDTNL